MSANPDYIKAMRELRRSSAASRHVDRHANARKGFGKGGRKSWKTRLDTRH